MATKKNEVKKTETKKVTAKATTKAEEKKPVAKTVAKAEEKKPVAKTVAKAEEKKPVAKTVAKAEEKKPVAKTVAKAEEKKPVAKTVAKTTEKKTEKKPATKVTPKVVKKNATKTAETKNEITVDTKTFDSLLELLAETPTQTAVEEKKAEVEEKPVKKATAKKVKKTTSEVVEELAVEIVENTPVPEAPVRKRNILLVASECVPFIKTGGLADVVGELPKYIDKDKFDVRVIIPNYRCIPQKYKDTMNYVTHFYMDLGWRRQYVGILQSDISGYPVYCVDNEYYFNGDRPYGNIYEDIEKYAFFNRAVLSALPLLGFRPDVIHCNDWQTGLLPVYLKDSFAAGGFYQGIKSIMTIHNLKFQGIWDKKTVMDVAGLHPSYFTPDKLEAYGDANYLKGGIVYADYVTTVSETYAGEIQTPFYGEGLDGLMRARNNCLRGIVNGIDYNEYNPETDRFIEHHFNADNFQDIKKKNKVNLQKELGLEVNEDVFMIGVCSRLTDQKGFDLVECVIEQLCAEKIQLVILGTGDQKYENLFRHYEWKYKDRVSASICYSEERSHKIYASCDAFLMPSLFEPCGLSQLMSMRYGTVPIVRETGGLKDTVRPFNEFDHEGTGFSFANYNAHEMLNIVRYAEHTYYENREAWNRLVRRAMETDYSWTSSARKYEELYYNLTY